MRRELLVIVIFAVFVLVIFSYGGTDFSLTGAAIVDSCAKQVQKVGKVCSRGATQMCTLAREDLRQCQEKLRATRLQAMLVKDRPECSYTEETGKKRCDTPTSRGVQRVVKELHDPTNSRCLTQWIVETACEPGNVCKDGACVGKPCTTNADCVAFGGKACQNGFCASLCEDTDGGVGRTHFVKGETTSGVGKKKTEEDYCFNDKMLIEWFCDPTYDVNRPGVKFINYEKVRCENSCSDGACKAALSRMKGSAPMS